MKMKRLRLSILALVYVVAGISAQEVVWSVDFNTIFDNREGDSKVADAKTFFLTQLSPEIGLSLLNGGHTVAGGIVWTQPIGCEWEGYRISPTLYYQYCDNGLQGFLGMFPREKLYRPLPDYIWNDSVYYVQRNIRGAGLVSAGRHGFIQALLDWRGMQTKTQREAFNVIAMGEWYKSDESPLSLGGLLMINHLALRENAPEDEGVVDNILYNPYIGVRFEKWLPSLKEFYVKSGVLGSISRDRKGENRWKVPAGFWLDITFRWKWIGVREELYAGSPLFPFYHKYGALLDQGEPYFSSDFYSRTEVKGYIIDKSFVTLKASLDFHVTSTDFIFYQRLILNINFDGGFATHRKNKTPMLQRSL